MTIWYGLTTPNGPFLRALPLLSGVAVGLLASGFTHLKQYWKELLILFFLGVPSIFSEFFIDISPITAWASSILLLYLGFDVYKDGTEILMSQSSIEVVYDCSGIDQINYLLGLSVLCLVMFPLRGLAKQFFVTIIGVILGFIANVARVAMMAVFANFNQEAFKFWHTGEGSYVFAMIAVFFLGFIYNFLLKQDELAVN